MGFRRVLNEILPLEDWKEYGTWYPTAEQLAEGQTEAGNYWDESKTGDMWKQTSKRLPPIWEQAGPAVEGFKAIEGILSDPYGGVGAEGQGRIAAGGSQALDRAGHAAGRLQPGGPPSTEQPNPFARRDDRQPRQHEPRRPDRGRQIGEQAGQALAQFDPSIAVALNQVGTEEERKYVLWALIQGDQRLQKFLFPYLEAYNQAYGTVRSHQEALANRPPSGGGFGFQDFLSVVGTGIATYGIIAACWVAREIYGVDDPRWLDVRHYNLNLAPKWWRDFYLKYGPRWAKALKGRPWLKRLHRPLFDWMARRGS